MEELVRLSEILENARGTVDWSDNDTIVSLFDQLEGIDWSLCGEDEE